MLTLTEEQMVYRNFQRTLRRWHHPDGDEAHFDMGQYEFTQSLFDYYNMMEEDRSALECHWALVLDAQAEYLDRPISRDTLCNMFLNALEAHIQITVT
jgi:hypothetical protein